MAVPLAPEKFSSKPFFNPSDFVGYIRERGGLGSRPAPEAVILSYQASLFDYVKERHATKEADGYFGDKLLYVEETSGRVAIVGRFGIGSPAAGVMIEELIAWGVRRFVSMGFAGSLRLDLPPGSLVLCEGAFRDEGTSYHYAREGEAALPDGQLTKALGEALAKRGLLVRRGISWTTDALYRETPLEVERHRDAGASVVEMEAAALFTIASYRGVSIASCFSVSDTLAELAWRPEFHSEISTEGLELLFGAALECLAS